MVTINKNNLIVLCASLALSACSTTKLSTNTSSEQGLTVSELYQQSVQQPMKRPIYHPIKLTRPNEEFKQLPNPEVSIHIFAHVAQLGDEQIIKPAYTTRFFLYKHNQYALASELY